MQDHDNKAKGKTAVNKAHPTFHLPLDSGIAHLIQHCYLCYVCFNLTSLDFCFGDFVPCNTHYVSKGNDTPKLSIYSQCSANETALTAQYNGLSKHAATKIPSTLLTTAFSSQFRNSSELPATRAEGSISLLSYVPIMAFAAVNSPS